MEVELGVRAGSAFITLGKREVLPLTMTFLDFSILRDVYHLFFQHNSTKSESRISGKIIVFEKMCYCDIKKNLKKRYL